MYPTEDNPVFGVFIKSQIDSLKKYVDIDLLVLSGGNGISPYLKDIPKITSKIKQQPDLIHIHYGNASTLVKLLHRSKIPIITSYCGDDLLGTLKTEKSYTLKSIVLKKINNFLSRLDTESIVKSDVLAQEIRGVAKKIHIIPNGVDTEKFNFVNKNEARKVLKLQVSEDKKIILFPADTKNPRKNFKLLSDALSKINNKNYQVLTFENRTVTPDLVPLYLNAADLVISTSFYEGSPNIIKEAMACNCSVFSTDCGDVKWLLDEVNGSKILSYSEEEWTKELEIFLTKNNDQTIVNAREMLIKKELDIDSVAKKIIRIYDSITSKN